MSDLRKDRGHMGDVGTAAIGALIAHTAGNWLTLAAAPVFALMAMLTATSDSAANLLCGGAMDWAPWHGMTLMYGLMSVFHAAPWLKIFSHRADRSSLTGGLKSGGADVRYRA